MFSLKIKINRLTVITNKLRGYNLNKIKVLKTKLPHFGGIRLKLNIYLKEHYKNKQKRFKFVL